MPTQKRAHVYDEFSLGVEFHYGDPAARRILLRMLSRHTPKTDADKADITQLEFNCRLAEIALAKKAYLEAQGTWKDYRSRHANQKPETLSGGSNRYPQFISHIAECDWPKVIAYVKAHGSVPTVYSRTEQINRTDWAKMKIEPVVEIQAKLHNIAVDEILEDHHVDVQLYLFKGLVRQYSECALDEIVRIENRPEPKNLLPSQKEASIKTAAVTVKAVSTKHKIHLRPVDGKPEIFHPAKVARDIDPGKSHDLTAYDLHWAKGWRITYSKVTPPPKKKTDPVQQN